MWSFSSTGNTPHPYIVECARRKLSSTLPGTSPGPWWWMSGLPPAVLHPPFSFFVKPEPPTLPLVLPLRKGFRSYFSPQNPFPNEPKVSLEKATRSRTPAPSPLRVHNLHLPTTFTLALIRCRSPPRRGKCRKKTPRKSGSRVRGG